MEVEYPIQDFDLSNNNGMSLNDVIAKNFNTIVNIIQSHALFDKIHLENYRELCNVLHVMINENNNDINIYSENNRTLGSFRDAGLDINNISARRNKLFPTLTPWQIRDVLQQLESVLWFVTDLKTGLMDDFKINNLFSIYKINNVGDLINSVHSYLNSHYNFGDNTNAEFSLMIRDDDCVDSVIKSFKRKKFLNEKSRQKMKTLLANCLVYEITFNFCNLGLYMNPLKNF